MDKNIDTQIEHYTVCVGSAIVNGPRVDADVETIKEFFEGIEEYKKEHGKDSIRVYGPKPH